MPSDPQPSPPEPAPASANRPRAWLDLLLVACVANFVLSWVIGVFVIGGDARAGKIEDGRHFLWSNAKGYTEVSAATFAYSDWHGISVMVSWPFVIVYGAVRAIMEWDARRLAAERDRSV